MRFLDHNQPRQSVSKPACISAQTPPQRTACSPKRSVSVSVLNVVSRTPALAPPIASAICKCKVKCLTCTHPALQQQDKVYPFLPGTLNVLCVQVPLERSLLRQHPLVAMIQPEVNVETMSEHKHVTLASRFWLDILLVHICLLTHQLIRIIIISALLCSLSGCVYLKSLCLSLSP